MHEQIDCEINGLELEDGYVVYDKCNEYAWVEMHPESAVMGLRQ